MDRIEDVDDLGRQAGFMGLQHIKYRTQWQLKTKQIQDVFKRIGKMEDIKVEPTIGMVNPWNYRNKHPLGQKLL